MNQIKKILHSFWKSPLPEVIVAALMIFYSRPQFLSVYRPNNEISENFDLQLPPALGEISKGRGPASTSLVQSPNCTEDTSNSCFNVVHCTTPKGAYSSYVDATTNTTFAIVALTFGFKSPGELLGPFESEFHQARKVKTQEVRNRTTPVVSERHRQIINSDHLTTIVSRIGRKVRAQYLLNQNIPSCVNPGDIR